MNFTKWSSQYFIEDFHSVKGNSLLKIRAIVNMNILASMLAARSRVQNRNSYAEDTTAVLLNDIWGQDVASADFTFFLHSFNLCVNTLGLTVGISTESNISSSIRRSCPLICCTPRYPNSKSTESDTRMVAKCFAKATRRTF